MALNGFGALQFVPLAPVVLAEIKAKVLYTAFCHLFFLYELPHKTIKINFSLENYLKY